jgi:hypothetical protein
MDGRYAGFAGAKTGHGLVALFWRFVLLNGFSFAFAKLGRSYQNSVLAVWRDKIAWSDFEPLKAGPQGGGQEVRNSTP